METRATGVDCSLELPLETSLVEWKPSQPSRRAVRWETLETSLVEWKRSISRCLRMVRVSLGNFLSGMETGPPPRTRSEWCSLGNFLSGMETRPCSLKILSKESKYVKIVV